MKVEGRFPVFTRFLRVQKIPIGSKSYKGTIWHQIRISRSGGRQKICQIVEMKIRGNIICSKRTSRLGLSMERIPSKPGPD